MLLLFPPAKINLGLLITGKRPDGYHLLETLFLPMPELHDKMELRFAGKAGDCVLSLSGRPLEGDPEQNLVVKAYRALERHVGSLPGVAIQLEKHIPAGAGLGGGSSNAASLLHGMNQLCALGLDTPTLSALAAPLGADVPFFLYDSPMIATGIGTELTPFELALPYRIELVTPPIHSSTIAAYKALDYRIFDPGRSLRDILAKPATAWKETLPNDLEVPVFKLHPEISRYKEDLYARGAIYAAMSGSGSACFGLFER
ncbi:MAG: 4-(cytidine 5'-diphospho)-2-C-methyl-D-erythritol kinase [Bacteroidia bacterium]|nr:4-(cytidine 5'-diphospho)-2-C-methyl-D-erythritol kinase [Bacteroidia bacterium]